MCYYFSNSSIIPWFQIYDVVTRSYFSRPFLCALAIYMTFAYLEQDVPHFWAKGFKMAPYYCHVQLSIAMHMDAGGDLSTDCCFAYVWVVLTGEKQMLQT